MMSDSIPDRCTLRRAGTRDVVLLGVALVLLVAAGLIYGSCRGGGDAAPTDQFVTLYCPECQYTFRISQRAFEKRWDHKEYRTTPDRTITFKCDKCGKMTATPGEPGAPPPAGPAGP
jgi:hypothetical protein